MVGDEPSPRGERLPPSFKTRSAVRPTTTIAEGAAPTAQELFKGFLKTEIQPFLKSKGFPRHGQSFLRWNGKNCEVINFQGSKWNTRENCEFAVNLGVFNWRIFVFDTRHDPVPKFPSAWDCHWHVRLNELLPNHPPEWWTIRREVEPAILGASIRAGLDAYGLPEMDKVVTDEGLRDFWLANGREDLFLAVLLAEIGPEPELDRVLEEYRRRMAERSLDRISEPNIARLRALRPKG